MNTYPSFSGLSEFSVNENVNPTEIHSSSDLRIQTVREFPQNSTNYSNRSPLSNRVQELTSPKLRKTIQKSNKVHFSRAELAMLLEDIDGSNAKLATLFSRSNRSITRKKASLKDEVAALQLAKGFTKTEAAQEILKKAKKSISPEKETVSSEWSHEEIEHLKRTKEKNPTWTYQQLANHVKSKLKARSTHNILKKCSELFKKAPSNWSEEDKEILRTYREKYPNLETKLFIPQVKLLLKSVRTDGAIFEKMVQLQLLKDKTNWSPAGLRVVKTIVSNNPHLFPAKLIPLVRSKLEEEKIEQDRPDSALQNIIKKERKFLLAQ